MDNEAKTVLGRDISAIRVFSGDKYAVVFFDMDGKEVAGRINIEKVLEYITKQYRFKAVMKRIYYHLEDPVYIGG
jgi:hypothetical protein